MSQAGKIRQFLDGLRVKDLRALHRKFAPRVAPYEKDSDRYAFILRLGRSLKRAIKRGDTTFSDLVRFAVKDAENRNRSNNTTIIENTLHDLVFSRSLLYNCSKSVREHIICGQTFQALRMAFSERPHTTICVEKSFGGNSLKVDICVTAKNPQLGTTYYYPIEVKRASKTQNVKNLPRQLDKYRKYVTPKPNRIYVFVVEDKEGALDKKHVRNTLNGAQRRGDTTVIVKENSDVRQSLSSR